MAARRPGIRQRMERAAMKLYAENGFEQTTAAQIAAAAGTTERTFFRHFGDKVEAAFGDEGRLQELVAEVVRTTVERESPWLAMEAGITALANQFDVDAVAMQRRARIVAENTAVRERELSRHDAWVSLAADALIAGGVEAARAQQAAAMGLSLFRVALVAWMAEPASALADHVHATFLSAARIAADSSSGSRAPG